MGDTEDEIRQRSLDLWERLAREPLEEEAGPALQDVAGALTLEPASSCLPGQSFRETLASLDTPRIRVTLRKVAPLL